MLSDQLTNINEVRKLTGYDARSMDAIMMSLFNSREREVDEWKDLFRAVDERFGAIQVNRIGENGSSGVISAEWVA